MATPYEVLGVQPNSSKEDIRKAWLGKVKENHPDLVQDENKKKEANDKTAEINRAYEELTNDKPKPPHFQQGNPFQQGGFHFDFGNIFDQIHRQQQFRSHTQINQDVEVSLIDVLKGKDLEIDIHAIQKRIKFPIPTDFASGKTYQIRISEDRAKNQGILILNLKLNLVIGNISEEQKKKIIEVLSM